MEEKEMKNNVLDEQLICQEYQETNLGIEALATRYHVGKLKIKKILADNNIPLKKKGRQLTNTTPKTIQDYHEEKYKPIPNHHYIAVDRETGFTTNDYMNKGGILTTYIKEQYSQETTLYERRKYYMETGDYWWEQYFEIKSVPNDEVKHCPYCDWTTTDLENKSGMFLTHLKKAHGIDRDRYLSEHPEDREYFSYSDPCRQKELSLDPSTYVTCKICGKRMDKISTRHLQKHGITRDDYIGLYGKSDIMTSSTYAKFRKLAYGMNINPTYNHRSKAEIEICEYLVKHNIEYVANDRSVIGPREIDIYIPSKHIGIEYNGILYHAEGSNHIDKYYHYNKMLDCKKNDVSLVTIFEDEFTYHRNAVYTKLDRLFGIGKKENSVGNIHIDYIDKATAKEFIETNDTCDIKTVDVYLGVYSDEILIGAVTFQNIKQSTWQIADCIFINNNPDTLKQAFEFFIKTYAPSKVYGYADRRWVIDEANNVYTSMGLKFDSYTQPDFAYINSSRTKYKRYYRTGINKESLLQANPQLSNELTEAEILQTLGYRRIWDCGYVKYVYENIERARIGFMTHRYEVYVVTDDTNTAPHVHIKSNSNEVCIELTKAAYLPHDGVSNNLTTELVNRFTDFMDGPCKNTKFTSNYEFAVNMWNANNANTVNNIEIPNYRQMII